MQTAYPRFSVWKENIPSIAKKSDFCMMWMNSIQQSEQQKTREQRRQFLLNQICFAS